MAGENKDGSGVTVLLEFSYSFGGYGMESRALVLLLTFVVHAVAGPGFGTMRRKYIELKTRQPASVRLFNTSIAFTGSSTNREYTPVQESLLATLETELVSNEKTLVKKNTAHEAEWTLSLKVTGFSIANPQQRVETNGKSSTSYTRWSGSLNAAYQVLDRTGHVHDASNVSDVYNKEFNTSGGGGIMSKIPTSIHGMGKKPGAPQVIPQTPEDVKQIMIKDVVQQIATQLGNTTKSLQVEVAVGDEHLNRAQEFMDKQLWSRALDELEKTPAYPKPDEEAYRQYDIGLAYEAMSYDSKNASEQRENVFKAAEYYDKSLELNTKEKYFVESVARTKDAIARFKALDLQNTSQKAPVGGAPKSAAKAAATTIKVTDVIEMYAAGVDQDQIVDIVQNSPVVFDPRDKDTVLAMAKAKLPVALQNELRKKVGAALLSVPATRNAAKKQ
jgi:hypothetical protein